VAGLDEPTDLAVSAEGAVLYTTRKGGLWAKLPGELARLVFAPADGDEVASTLSVAIDPRYSANRFLYVAYASREGTDETFSVVRISVDDAFRHAGGIEVLMARAANSNGRQRRFARLRFGPDGHLHAALSGTVLRITREGRPPRGESSIAAALQELPIYAGGFQNPRGLAFHPDTEHVVIGDDRSQSVDELVRVTPEHRGAAPKVLWRGSRPDDELSGVERLRAAAWGAWQNSFAVSFERGRRVELVKMLRGGSVRSTSLLAETGAAFAAIAEGPDGLYVATTGRMHGDEIWRIRPQ
jgi:glucose/arabinose dehydrogenase